MSQLEIVFGHSKKIEALLQSEFGAVGRGLHTKLDSVEQRLPAALVKKLRWIATVRNNLAHTEGFAIEDIGEFSKSCDAAIAELKAISQQGSHLLKKRSGKFPLTLEAMEDAPESCWHTEKGEPRLAKKRGGGGLGRGLRITALLILGFATLTWYSQAIDPSVYWKLKRFVDDNTKPRAWIRWSSPETSAKAKNAGGVKTANPALSR